VKIFGPLTVQLSPSWIFNSPAEGFEESGFDIGADIAWYPLATFSDGRVMKGIWVKAHFEYEWFEATMFRDLLGNETYTGVPDPELCDADSETGTCTKTIQSAIVGALFGGSWVYGSRAGGFIVSGGIGIGVALAETVALQVNPCTEADVTAGSPHCTGGAEPAGSAGLQATYYNKSDRIRLLGSLSLGIAF